MVSCQKVCALFCNEENSISFTNSKTSRRHSIPQKKEKERNLDLAEYKLIWNYTESVHPETNLKKILLLIAAMFLNTNCVSC